METTLTVVSAIRKLGLRGCPSQWDIRNRHKVLHEISCMLRAGYLDFHDKDHGLIARCRFHQYHPFGPPARGVMTSKFIESDPNTNGGILHHAHIISRYGQTLFLVSCGIDEGSYFRFDASFIAREDTLHIEKVMIGNVQDWFICSSETINPELGPDDMTIPENRRIYLGDLL